MNANARLAYQPELKLLPNGGSVCEFRLLDSRFAKGEEVTEAVTFFCYDQLAEEFCERCVKGQVIEASGVQETQSYQPQGAEKKHQVVKYRLTWFKPGAKPRNPGGDARQEQSAVRPQAQPPRRAAAGPVPAATREHGESVPKQHEEQSAKTGFF